MTSDDSDEENISDSDDDTEEIEDKIRLFEYLGRNINILSSRVGNYKSLKMASAAIQVLLKDRKFV